MKPSVPIVPGHELPVVEIAKNQPEYFTLPVHRAPDGVLLSRWRLSLRERLIVLFFGDVYFFQHTFNRPMQPVSLQVEKPRVHTPEFVEPSIPDHAQAAPIG